MPYVNITSLTYILYCHGYIILSSSIFLYLKYPFHFQVQIVSLDEETSDFSAKSSFEHPYPTTKIMWIPDTVSNNLIIFITSQIISLLHALVVSEPFRFQ